MRALSPFFILLSGTISTALPAQVPHPIPLESAQAYFAEAQSICGTDHGALWGISLCGPIMFVDPPSRFVVANQPDQEAVLKAEDQVYIGTLPTEQNIANTAVKWSGTYWTQMLWPLPLDAHQRQTLIAHELFHRIQDQLNLPSIKSGDNAHLDTLDGRYLLQLEWRALARALEATTDTERRQATSDAILFRMERYRIFPDAAMQEQALELNEGLAEYTGVRVGNPNAPQQIKAALLDLSNQQKASTYVRSFAYATGPAYGLLLDRYAPNWHQELKTGKSLATLLESSLAITLPADLKQATNQRAEQYEGATLHAAEVERESKRQQLVAFYRNKFLSAPILTLPFRHMHVQFDPRNLQPLDQAGTVYPTMRISDDWGVLEAKNGALMKQDWSAVIVSAPAATTGSSLTGDGWTLELKSGWRIIPGSRPGDWILSIYKK